MSQARISKVTMKNGGAVVRVIRRAENTYGGESYPGKLIEHAKKTAGYSEPGCELVGYFIVGVYTSGRASTSWRLDPERCPVPRKLMPAYVTELMRESMITCPAANNEAVDVFNNQWVPRK